MIKWYFYIQNLLSISFINLNHKTNSRFHFSRVPHVVFVVCFFFNIDFVSSWTGWTFLFTFVIFFFFLWGASIAITRISIISAKNKWPNTSKSPIQTKTLVSTMQYLLLLLLEDNAGTNFSFFFYIIIRMISKRTRLYILF